LSWAKIAGWAGIIGAGGSIHILRGLLANGRFEATGAEAPALAERILSKDCPISAALKKQRPEGL
jgi:hypothetical protein